MDRTLYLFLLYVCAINFSQQGMNVFPCCDKNRQISLPRERVTTRESYDDLNTVQRTQIIASFLPVQPYTKLSPFIQKKTKREKNLNFFKYLSLRLSSPKE